MHLDLVREGLAQSVVGRVHPTISSDPVAFELSCVCEQAGMFGAQRTDITTRAQESKPVSVSSELLSA